MRSLLAVACVILSPVAFAQHLFSFGVKGGFPLTDPLSDDTFHSVDVVTHAFSASKNYVIGPMVELNLPFGLAVEADALYRPLNLTTETQLVSSPSLVNRLSVDASSMYLPVLLKARF